MAALGDVEDPLIYNAQQDDSLVRVNRTVVSLLELRSNAFLFKEHIDNLNLERGRTVLQQSHFHLFLAIFVDCFAVADYNFFASYNFKLVGQRLLVAKRMLQRAKHFL